MKTIPIPGVLLLLMLALTGCPPREIVRPQQSVLPVALPPVDNSVITIPVDLYTHTFAKELLSTIPSPVDSGSTPKVNFKFLAAEKVTIEKLVKEVLVPYRPAYYYTIFKEVMEVFKAAFECTWKKPWGWFTGQCYYDNYRKVLKPIQVWVEPQLEVARMVLKPFAEIQDRIYPADASARYDVYLTDLEHRFIDNKVHVAAFFTIKVRLNYEQAALPLGPTIMLKGSTACEMKTRIDLAAEINITNDLELKVRVLEDEGKIEFTKICLPGAVEAFDVVTVMNPVMLAQRKALAFGMNKVLTEQVQKAIDEKNISFRARLNELVEAFRQPIAVDTNIWFQPFLKKAFISPIMATGIGRDNKLSFTVGMVCTPRLTYSTTIPAPDTSGPFQFAVENANSQILLNIENRISYTDASLLVKNALQNFIEQRYGTAATYFVQNVGMYPSGQSVTIMVDLQQKSGTKKFTYYMTSTLAYNDSSREFYFRELGLTPESRQPLLGTAPWFTDDEIIRILTQATPFRTKPETLALINRSGNFGYSTRDFIFKGQLQSVGLSPVYADNSGFAVYLSLNGNASVVIRPPYQVMDNTAKLVYVPQQTLPDSIVLPVQTGNMLSLGQIMNPDKVPTSKPPELAGAGNKKMKAAAIPQVVAAMPRFISAGDTIFYDDVNGKLRYRIAGWKDAHIPGDTMFVETAPGKIEMFIKPSR